MLRALRTSAVQKSLARQLCADLLAQSRQPVFFKRLEVADTMDGRFDLVALHAWLVLDRIGENARLAQALVDEIFLSFEEALRELGTGDAGMNRRLKTLAGAFYGRIHAYTEAQSCDGMAAAILQNVYRGAERFRPQALAVATYSEQARLHLESNPLSGKPLEFGSMLNI